MLSNHKDQASDKSAATDNQSLVRFWKLFNVLLAFVIAIALIDDFHTLQDAQGSIRWERFWLFCSASSLAVIALVEFKTLKISRYFKSLIG